MSVTYMLHICPHIYAIYVVAYMAYMVHICSFLYAAYMSFPYGMSRQPRSVHSRLCAPPRAPLHASDEQ